MFLSVAVVQGWQGPDCGTEVEVDTASGNLTLESSGDGHFGSGAGSGDIGEGSGASGDDGLASSGVDDVLETSSNGSSVTVLNGTENGTESSGEEGGGREKSGAGDNCSSGNNVDSS